MIFCITLLKKVERKRKCSKIIIFSCCSLINSALTYSYIVSHDISSFFQLQYRSCSFLLACCWPVLGYSWISPWVLRCWAMGILHILLWPKALCVNMLWSKALCVNMLWTKDYVWICFEQRTMCEFALYKALCEYA